MVNTIDEAKTPAELAQWLRLWTDGYEEGVDYLDDNDARQLADAVDRVCAPCNAAALREALEQALAYCESDQKSGIAYSDNDILVPILRAALATPARNCDRPECRTEEGASATYISEHPHEVEPDASTYGSWLLATAKGGVK
jgi:hypothetical protein